MFSIASIATMAACIFLFGLFYSIIVNFNYIVEKAEEGVAITVLFDEDTTKEEKEDIGEKLEAADGVLKIDLCQRRRGSVGELPGIVSILKAQKKRQKDSKTIIHLRILTTTKYICPMFQSRKM